MYGNVEFTLHSQHLFRTERDLPRGVAKASTIEEMGRLSLSPTIDAVYAEITPTHSKSDIAIVLTLMRRVYPHRDASIELNDTWAAQKVLLLKATKTKPERQALSRFVECTEREMQSIKKQFPNHTLEKYSRLRINGRLLAHTDSNEYIQEWHQDSFADPRNRRILRTLYGRSTELAENKMGDQAITPANESIVIITDRAYHQAPLLEDAEERLTLDFFLNYKQ